MNRLSRKHIILIAALCAAGLAGIIVTARVFRFIVYGTIGELEVLIEGSPINAKDLEISVQAPDGTDFADTARIIHHKFALKPRHYGSDYLYFILPGEYLGEYGKDIAVELCYYNNVVAVPKYHSIQVSVDNISRDSCNVTVTYRWEPACDFLDMVESELVSDREERRLVMEKVIDTENSYISNFGNSSSERNMHWRAHTKIPIGDSPQ